jgi:hypothetical protein
MKNQTSKYRSMLWAGVLLFLCGPGLLHAQDAPSDKDAVIKIFRSSIRNIISAKQRQDDAKKRAASLVGDSKAKAEEEARQAALDAQDALTNDMIPYVQFLTGGSVYRSLLSDLEEKRLDKQTEASSGTSGGTSPVSRGSVPSLLGFAVEHGGLVESTNDTIVTFRGNVANLVKALTQQDYVKSWIDPNSNPAIQGLQRLSFSVSFDTSQGATPGVFTGKKQQLAGASAHIDIYSKRDPRHPDYYRFWNNLVATSGGALANSLNALFAAIEAYADPATGTHPYDKWRTTARDAIASAGADQVETVVLKQAEEFREVFGNIPALQPMFRAAANALSAYAQERRQGLDKIAKSPIVSIEYNFTRQFPEATTLNAMASGATTVSPADGMRLPSLSSVTLVGVMSLGESTKAPELTGNATATFFDSLPRGSSAGRLRDYRLSAQLDVPLRDIPSVGLPRLSFSYLFLSLVEEPLGAKVTVNGKEVGTTGNIHLFQSKLTIAVKNSGIKIPISFTYSNRTELITETEKRGTIGITYDFDSLFAKPKGSS